MSDEVIRLQVLAKGLGKSGAHIVKDAIKHIEELEAQVKEADEENFRMLDECVQRDKKIEELEATALRSAAEHPIVQTLQDALDGCNKNNTEFAKQHREDKRKIEELEASFNDRVKVIEMQIEDKRKLQQRNEELEAILRVAKCPNNACDDKGTICNGQSENGEWDIEQCQWCAERDALLKGEGDG